MDTYKTYYIAINAMTLALDKENIPYTIQPLYDGFQLCFPWCKGDVACHRGTYGGQEGFVESYCFPWDDGDVTMDLPQRMVKKIIDYYNEIVKEN